MTICEDRKKSFIVLNLCMFFFCVCLYMRVRVCADIRVNATTAQITLFVLTI